MPRGLLWRRVRLRVPRGCAPAVLGARDLQPRQRHVRMRAVGGCGALGRAGVRVVPRGLVRGAVPPALPDRGRGRAVLRGSRAATASASAASSAAAPAATSRARPAAASGAPTASGARAARGSAPATAAARSAAAGARAPPQPKATGLCRCAAGYAGVDCGTPCAGLGPSGVCSGAGECHPGDGTCLCYSGFAGPGCEIPCPIGRGLVCTGHGVCDDMAAGDGTCACDYGYAMEACDVTCPGFDPKAAVPVVCGGHGLCSTDSALCVCDQTPEGAAAMPVSGIE